jgi:hypothetical protein
MNIDPYYSDKCSTEYEISQGSNRYTEFGCDSYSQKTGEQFDNRVLK